MWNAPDGTGDGILDAYRLSIVERDRHDGQLSGVDLRRLNREGASVVRQARGRGLRALV